MNPMEPSELTIKERGGRSLLPWLLTALAVGFASYLYAMVYRPLEAEDRRKGIELREQRALARDAKREAEEVKNELSKSQGDLKDARETAAQSTQVKEENEKLMAQLNEMKEAGVEVKREAGRITVTMVDRILFNTGEADLTQTGEQVLRKLGDVLKPAAKDKLIQVSGHTDTARIRTSIKDMYPTNWELSAARAINVVRFLQSEVGVNPRRLMAAAFGPYRPLASNASKAGKARNRRIEILLLPDEMKIVKGDFPELAEAEPARPAAKPAAHGRHMPAPAPAAAVTKSKKKR